MTFPASSDANLLEFLQLRSLQRPQSFSQFQLSHRPRLGGSPFLRKSRAREPQAHLVENLKTRASGSPRTTPARQWRGSNEKATENGGLFVCGRALCSRHVIVQWDFCPRQQSYKQRRGQHHPGCALHLFAFIRVGSIEASLRNASTDSSISSSRLD